MIPIWKVYIRLIQEEEEEEEEEEEKKKKKRRRRRRSGVLNTLSLRTPPLVHGL